MFTGLIEAVGSVESVSAGSRGLKIKVRCPSVSSQLAIGDSVNVDGVCQTVVDAGASAFSVEAVGDTLEKTTFRSLRRGASVNIERALRADGRFGGHIVMGHVTGTARVISWGPQQAAASAHGATGTGGAAVSAGAEDGAWFLVLELNPSWLDRVAPEGSIAVDGVSLTVAGKTGLNVRLSIIPHTRKATTFALKKPGDLVNIELDILASYVRAIMSAAPDKGRGITLEALSSWGYA